MLLYCQLGDTLMYLCWIYKMFYIYHEHDDVKTLLLPVAPKFPSFTSENTGE